MLQYEHTFKHSGKLGDIIYSLPTIRALGGGVLHLAECPELKFGSREIGAILPLLRVQPYIRGVKIWDGTPVDYDLDSFRSGRVDRTNLASLFLSQFGISDSERDRAWLDLPVNHEAMSGRTVIGRSLHYHGVPEFWPAILSRFGESAVFVGTEEEHQQFIQEFGFVSFHPTKDLLELAKAIQSADRFIGNQSCPYAIAEGLKKPAIQECDRWSPNCVFDRPNTFYVSNFRHITKISSGDQLASNAFEVALARRIRPEPGPYANQLSPASIPGASIIILTFNSVATVEECLQSVLPTLTTADELIIVDNASSDGTADYLRNLVGKIPATIILNEKNLGFSAGCNVGILESRGQAVVLLNPDTVVTDGWIQRLAARFIDSSIGAVGPVSDNALSVQFVQFHLPADYSGSTNPKDFASAIEKEHGGHSTETKLLIGFCLMVRRDVLNQVGLLDESMFVGSEDLELSWRLREFGFKLLVARDVFVAHRCGKSFASLDSGVKDQMLSASTRALVSKIQRAYAPQLPPSSFELWNLDIVPDDLMLMNPDKTSSDAMKTAVSNPSKRKGTIKPDKGQPRAVLPGFHEKWFSEDSIFALEALAHKLHHLKGAVIEIGCWEGAGAVTLANAVKPEIVYAVDHWQGNVAESPDHVTTRILEERDVKATFEINIRNMTEGNVKLLSEDCHKFEASFKRPIKLCHIDASHDYESVKQSIINLVPKVVSGGILCGDDFLSAHANRKDLDGGVERAVRELLPEFYQRGNFWYWVKP